MAHIPGSSFDGLPSAGPRARTLDLVFALSFLLAGVLLLGRQLSGSGAGAAPASSTSAPAPVADDRPLLLPER